MEINIHAQSRPRARRAELLIIPTQTLNADFYLNFFQGELFSRLFCQTVLLKIVIRDFEFTKVGEVAPSFCDELLFVCSVLSLCEMTRQKWHVVL